MSWKVYLWWVGCLSWKEKLEREIHSQWEVQEGADMNSPSFSEGVMGETALGGEGMKGEQSREEKLRG